MAHFFSLIERRSTICVKLFRVVERITTLERITIIPLCELAGGQGDKITIKLKS